MRSVRQPVFLAGLPVCVQAHDKAEQSHVEAPQSSQTSGDGVVEIFKTNVTLPSSSFAEAPPPQPVDDVEEVPNDVSIEIVPQRWSDRRRLGPDGGHNACA